MHSLFQSMAYASAVSGEAWEKCGVFKLRYTAESGIIQNWDSAKEFWQHIYAKELHINPAMHPVLLTESPSNSPEDRGMMLKMFFDEFWVPSLYIANTAMLSLFASGRNTGIVLGIGQDGAISVAISNGKLLDGTLH